MTDRSRYNDVSGLLAILTKHAKTRTWLRYDENPKVQDAKTLPDLIKPQHDLLGDLFKLQDNLSFVRSTVVSSMSLLFANSFDEWSLTEGDKDDWVYTMVNRFQNLCRAVGQGSRKHPLPPWASALPWHMPVTAAAKQVSGEIKYLYGFNEEVGMPWRVDSKHPKNPPEFALKVNCSRLATQPIIATFVDGTNCDIVDFDCARYEQYMSHSRKAHSAAPFDGTHKTTKHKIKVAKRSDRQPLVSIYEQQKQILQVAVKYFEGDSEEAQEQAAIVFMVDLATLYCEALVTKDDLKTKRNLKIAQLMQQKKIKSPGILKRPASSMQKKPAMAMTAEAEEAEEVEDEEAAEVEESDKEGEEKHAKVMKKPSSSSSVGQPSSTKPAAKKLAAKKPAAAQVAAAQVAEGDGEEVPIEVDDDDLFLEVPMPEPDLGDIGSAFALLL